MKKILLLLGVLPCLLSAQNVVKERSLVKQMIKDKQLEDRVLLYSGSEKNLPDSVYTYHGQDKDLISKSALTYDNNGRIVQEKGVRYLNYDGVSQGSEEYKIDYVYTQKGNLIEEDVTTSYLVNGEWISAYKVVSVYNSADLYSPIEYYVYNYDGDNWVLDWSTTATEFDDKNRPIVYMDSTFYPSYDADTFVMRMNMVYNEIGLYSLITTFIPVDEAGEEWMPLEKIELVYNEDGKLVRDVHSDYDKYVLAWIPSYTYSYEYDEAGNRISEIESSEYGVTDEIYYTNIYSSIPDANSVLLSVQAKIYPNPVSDVLYVTLEGIDNAVVTLVNAAGRVVAQQNISHSIASIPVQSFAKGYYFLVIQTSKGTKTHKVIIR